MEVETVSPEVADVVGILSREDHAAYEIWHD